jgi:hypothetical protein
MKLPADKSSIILITMAVTYLITVVVLMNARKSGDSVTGIPAPNPIVRGPDAPSVPAGFKRPNPQGQPGRGMRPQPRDPAQRDPA